MSTFASKMIDQFLIAFGVVIGGCLLAGIAAVVTLKNPTHQMLTIAENIKIWAMVVAVGGSIDPIRYIESHLQRGQVSTATMQILYIISAFIGAHLGTTLIQWICKGGGES